MAKAGHNAVMHDGIQTFVQLVGYPGLATVVFLESGVPFGFLFPGSSMLFAAGLLSAHQIFDPWVLIPLVTLAAIAGDSVGYWLGSTVGVRLFDRDDARFFNRTHLDEARAFYAQYGKQAVFFGRFVPIVRTFIPIVAGIAQMRYPTFLAYNILGAVIWAAGVTLAGFWLGEIPFVREYLTHILIAIVAISFLPIVWKIWRQDEAK